MTDLIEMERADDTWRNDSLVQRLADEIERLQAEIEHMQAVIDRVALIRLDLESENRRLTAEVSELKTAMADAYEPGCDCATCTMFRKFTHITVSDNHETGPSEGFGSNRSDVPQAGEYGSGDSGGPSDVDGQEQK